MPADEITVDNGVDFPELLARVEYDWELLREVYGIFINDYPEILEQLKTAVLRGELNLVRTTAHTLKGMLASLSFRAASACAMRIEKLASANISDGIPDELARLASQTALASDQLRARCEEVIR